MRLAPWISAERGANGLFRLGLHRVHDAVLVGERPAQDDEALIDETIHEGRVAAQSDCSSMGRGGSTEVRIDGAPRGTSPRTFSTAPTRVLGWASHAAARSSSGGWILRFLALPSIRQC